MMGTAHPTRAPVSLAFPPADPSSAPARDGWPAELVALHRERRTALVRLAYLLTSDAGAAEEIVDGAVLALRARWADVDGPRAFLQTAVVDRSRSWLRRHGTPRRRHEAASVDGPGGDRLWAALPVLREKERAALVLRVYEELPEAEVAALLRCRPAAVRSLVDHGLDRLRREVEA